MDPFLAAMLRGAVDSAPSKPQHLAEFVPPATPPDQVEFLQSNAEGKDEHLLLAQSRVQAPDNYSPVEPTSNQAQVQSGLPNPVQKDNSQGHSPVQPRMSLRERMQLLKAQAAKH